MQNSIKAIILVVLKTNNFVQKYKYFYLYGIIFCIKTCPGLVSNMLYYNELPVYVRTKICPLFCCMENCIQICGAPTTSLKSFWPLCSLFLPRLGKGPLQGACLFSRLFHEDNNMHNIVFLLLCSFDVK